MRTYQDLEQIGDDEAGRMSFLRSAVADHRSSKAYQVARDAEAYYAKKNVTILKYQKFIMNSLGQKTPDIWSSDYKLTHGFFRQFVIQQVQYVLSHGVSFEGEGTKEMLGKDFDNKIQQLAKKAMVDGVSFGFWNYDHLDVFSFADTPKEPGFAPLWDEDTGMLRAGVRYWKPTEETKRWTLYEQDGYTDYIEREGEAMQILREKQPYVQTVISTEAGGVEEVEGRNYPGFPIIPMYANDLKESELIGIRPSIDCYDFIMSGMANNIDETSAFYWTLKGTGGMDDEDLLNFVNKMRQLHATVLDRGVEAEAHTLDVPVDANKMLLDYLKDDMYENFMLMNPSKALSGNMTATAIRLSYQQQDDKCGDFEYCIRDFIYKLLDIVGIEDEPTFRWNRIANQLDETNMVMTAANYLDDETLLNHLPWLTPEEVQVVMARKAGVDVDRMMQTEELNGEEDLTEETGEEDLAGETGEEELAEEPQAVDETGEPAEEAETGEEEETEPEETESEEPEEETEEAEDAELNEEAEEEPEEIEPGEEEAEESEEEPEDETEEEPEEEAEEEPEEEAGAYEVEISFSEGGSVSAEPEKAEAGEVVTLTAEAEEGYSLVSLTVVDADGNEIKVAEDGTFEMPEGGVSVVAVFEAEEDAEGEEGEEA